MIIQDHPELQVELPMVNTELTYPSFLTLPGINAQERFCMAPCSLRPTPRTCKSKKLPLLHYCTFSMLSLFNLTICL